jgi:hypothetical protein
MTSPLPANPKGSTSCRFFTGDWIVAEWEGGDRGISFEDQFKLIGVLPIRPEQLLERPG